MHKVNGTAAEPGPNPRTVVDTRDTLYLSEGILKRLYYCDNCEKAVEAEIQTTYNPVEAEITVQGHCAECKMPLDTAVRVIAIRDNV